MSLYDFTPPLSKSLLSVFGPDVQYLGNLKKFPLSLVWGALTTFPCPNAKAPPTLAVPGGAA